VGLHVRVLGESGPTFLLLHGFVGSNRYFGGAFDALADGARLIAPDLLGFGDSPWPVAGDYGAESQARSVSAALEQLGVEPPVFVGAHSAGTLVALRLAAQRPAWIGGIAAFGPPLYRNETEARAHLEQLGWMARLFVLDGRWTRLACGAMCRMRGAAALVAPWLRRDLPKAIAQDGVRHNWYSYAGTLRDLILAADPAADLQRVRAPVRLIAGDRDSVVDLVFLREQAAAHTNLRLEIWSGGHDLPLSEPQRCIDVLREIARAGLLPR
jgi:pimeloyl-ACP methyl ester carboxylesterase